MKKVQNQFLSILCCKLTKKAVLTLKKNHQNYRFRNSFLLKKSTLIQSLTLILNSQCNHTSIESYLLI